MEVLQAKDFLVQETVQQAALEGVALSDLEKRMMYFTETGECPEDPIALNDAFEAENDTTAYEKKISLLMAQAYRRIQRESPEKLQLWNAAFRVLSRGDHYILLFWRRNASSKSPRMWTTYLLAALATVSIFLLVLFLFGNKASLRRGGTAPIDKFIPILSPSVQRILQLLFVLLFLFAIFPQLYSGLAGLLQRIFRSSSSTQQLK